MGMLRIMSKHGDERITWESQPTKELEQEAAAAVREAERIFNEARANGATAFKLGTEAQKTTRIDQFDPTAEQIVVVPRVIGG